MGDSEIVVAQTSTLVGYTSMGYTSTLYAQTGSNTITDAQTGDDSVLGFRDTDKNLTVMEVGSITAQETHHSVGKFDTTESRENQGNIPVNPSLAANYDSSAGGNYSSELRVYASNENGIASDVGGDAATIEQTSSNGSGLLMSSEEDRLWSIVRTNYLDFNAWTALIEESEKMAEGNIFRIRQVYDAFLVEFPLCYGYWKKYADHEAHIGSIDKAVEVYERAVQGVTYSVDIWIHYCIFAINTYGDPNTIRRLFERGLAYVGTDYLSYTLWDKYIEYEYLQQEWCRLCVIYTRILEHPNQQLDRYFHSFKELAISRPLSELRTSEEASDVPGISLESRGEEVEEIHPCATEQSPKPMSADFTEPEELGKYILIREEVYKKAKEFDSKIIGFETAIRRPYFHVRPLNVAELENWHNYLDFIEIEDDFNKVVKLYERCLIACANYPEYWIRYVLCMESGGNMDLANNALARATQVFVKRQPEIHLFAARFKEQNKDIEAARASYQLVHSEISPGLLEAIIKHANMEHRLGKLEDAFLLYEQAIAIEKGKEHSQALPMLFAQYSRFLYLVSGNANKAREILLEAIDDVQLFKPLLESLIHLESILPPPRRIDHLDSLVDKFLVPNPESINSASAADREALSCIFLEFLDLFGDAVSIKKADNRHAKLFLQHMSKSELRKRLSEDYMVSDKAKLFKSYPGIAQSNAQNQWAGYAVQPQAWPQATQAQPYSSYPQQTYGAYTTQTAAYAAYPAQAYAPSTTTAPNMPSQQLGSAYYGTYY